MVNIILDTLYPWTDKL